MAFRLTNVYHNADGWGPQTEKGEEGLMGVPYTPFSKVERYGRAVDWINPQQQQRFQYQRFTPSAASNFFSGAMRKDDDAGFQMVETQARALQPKRFPRFFNRGRGRGQYGRGAASGRSSGRANLPQRQSKFKTAIRNDWQQKRQFVHRNASVEVRPSWKVVSQFTLADLSKMEMAPPPAPEDLRICGAVDFYEPTNDRINVRNPVTLQDCNRSFYSVTTAEDPIVRELAQDVPAEPEHRVYATDAILAALMSSTRSVNSWDLSVEIMEYEGAKLVFFDKRDEFDLLPVNETSRDPPGPELALQLAEELALVNQRFSQQVLRKGAKKFPLKAEPHPFAEAGEDFASALYKYRKWKLDKNVSITARCQLDAVIKTSTGATQFCKLFALHEFDQKATDWRRKLETAAGAVLATEIKNNSCTLAKWAARAMLSGADVMKLGYVVRSNPLNRVEHALLQVQQHDPAHFARQNLSLNLRNMWAIVRTIVDTCIKLPEGKYVLLKDPNKQMLHMYSLPAEEEEEEEEVDAAAVGEKPE